MALARNETQQATLSVTVPPGTPGGEYQIWINATSQTNASCMASAIQTIIVPWQTDLTASNIQPFIEQGTYSDGQYLIFGDSVNTGSNSFLRWAGYG